MTTTVKVFSIFCAETDVHFILFCLCRSIWIVIIFVSCCEDLFFFRVPTLLIDLMAFVAVYNSPVWQATMVWAHMLEITLRTRNFVWKTRSFHFLLLLLLLLVSLTFFFSPTFLVASDSCFCGRIPNTCKPLTDEQFANNLKLFFSLSLSILIRIGS